MIKFLTKQEFLCLQSRGWGGGGGGWGGVTNTSSKTPLIISDKYSEVIL